VEVSHAPAFRPGHLDQVLNLTVAALRPGATLLAVHWRHPVAEYPRSGDNVHAALAARPELTKLAEHTEPDFLAETYLAGQGQPVSVAAAEGLLKDGDGRAGWRETGRELVGDLWPLSSAIDAGADALFAWRLPG
jgi:hypothetical protein